MKYRAVWIDKNGKIQLGVLTSLKNAQDERDFEIGLGFTAWVENSESERVG